MRNHRLGTLQPYPFERLNKLLTDITPADVPFISLALGEPKHAAADFLKQTFADEALISRGFGAYPPTKGLPELRDAIASFISQRFNIQRPVNPDTEVLPVNGSREGLFSIAQAMIDPADPGITLMPNPFYQIYEGAALLAGSEPVYMNCTEESQFLPDLESLSEATLNQCRLMYLCTPGNPSGATMPMALMQQAIEMAIKYNFIVVSDECYSEIYSDEDGPPIGLLEAAVAMGNHSFENCITFNSLSKRSNLPGLRSGYVAGNADLIQQFLLYRTYHGSAMSIHNQILSVTAWSDEDHVKHNRDLYREKYTRFTQILKDNWQLDIPKAGFYLWPQIPSGFSNDETFTQQLLATTNIKVLPGSYLSRNTVDLNTKSSTRNPGQNRVRMALVATVDECEAAAHRIASFLSSQV